MWAARLLTTIHHLGHLVQIGIDLVRQLIENDPTPCGIPATDEPIAADRDLLLDVVDDAPPVEAAMQAD